MQQQVAHVNMCWIDIDVRMQQPAGACVDPDRYDFPSRAIVQRKRLICNAACWFLQGDETVGRS